MNSEYIFTSFREKKGLIHKMGVSCLATVACPGRRKLGHLMPAAGPTMLLRPKSFFISSSSSASFLPQPNLASKLFLLFLPRIPVSTDLYSPFEGFFILGRLQYSGKNADLTLYVGFRAGRTLFFSAQAQFALEAYMGSSTYSELFSLSLQKTEGLGEWEALFRWVFRSQLWDSRWLSNHLTKKLLHL